MSIPPTLTLTRRHSGWWWSCWIRGSSSNNSRHVCRNRRPIGSQCQNQISSFFTAPRSLIWWWIIRRRKPRGRHLFERADKPIRCEILSTQADDWLRMKRKERWKAAPNQQCSKWILCGLCRGCTKQWSALSGSRGRKANYRWRYLSYLAGSGFAAWARSWSNV